MRIRRDGQPLALRPKTFALLVHLADRAGTVVGKQELMDAVWPGLVVTDDSLTQAVSELRGMLDDREQKLIKTIPKRGYLFDAAIRPAPEPEPAANPPAPAPPAVSAMPPRRRWAAALAVLLLVVAGALGVVAHLGPGGDTPIGQALVESRSLVVMPFTDLSEPPAPHLALAIDTGLSTDLGRLADIRVTPRASAAALGTSASVDFKRVARELGARHVVTGTVRRDGEQLQVTAQLVRANDGSLLWADRFEYASSADWLEQRDISARIANQLDLRMRDAALQQARVAPPNNQAADHWMRGAYMMSRLLSLDEMLQARQEFQAALALQPDSSHALAGLAHTHLRPVVFRWTDQRQRELDRSRRLAEQALAIDPQNQNALLALAGSLMFSGHIAGAMAVTRKHLELYPNDAHANGDLAAEYFFSGRWQEALQQADLAIRLNPLDRAHVTACHVLAATALIPLRRYNEAIARARLAIDGPRAGGYGIIASAEAWRGNLDAAHAAAAEFLQRQPGMTIERLRASRGSKEPAYLAGIEHHFEGLRTAGVPEGTPAAR
ncbi:MAG TPA: winged helix-turn-helix domain-containing protein [Rubrivivax sp.]|nr:winged helix-turn-helix domain-containing protein [Rubrivivax sp.]